MHELANYQERIFVITGMCRDLFCTPSNQMIFFDRLLHIYLKENLEYESVVFLDSRGIYYYDVESKNILKSIDDIKKTNAHSKLKRYKNLVIKKDDIKNNNQITERLRYTYQNDIAEIINFIIFHLGNQKRMAFIVYDDILFENLNRGSESWVLFHGFLRNNIMRLMPDVKNIIVFVSDKEDLLVADRYRRIHLEYLYSINENNVEGIAKRIFIPPSSSDEIKRVIMLNLLSLKIKPAYRDVEKLVDHLNGIFSVKELKLNLLINANEEKTSYYDSLKQKYYYKNNGISAWDELNQLIGVTDIKEKVKTLVQGIQKKNRTYVNDYQNMPNRVKTIEKESLPLIPHIALLGNSGTGKTTIARLIARILKEEGILEKGHLIESSRADLVSQYVGETGIKTRQLVEKALGGVLFIDEAYSLITGDNDTVGIEALSQLIGHMSAYQGQFMTIFAGYKEDTIKMLSYNQGGARRIQQWDINDYNEEELSEIMRYHLDKLNQPVDSFVFENTHNYCYHVLLNHSKFAKNNHFGNAGVITNIVNNAITKCLSLQSDKLKTEHFENQDFFKQVDRTKGQLDDLVGLDDIKDTLKVYFRRKKIENNLSPGHFVFTGNPGTGKTMVANMIAHELCRLKIINRAVIKNYSASELIKSAVGGTEEHFQKLLNSSLGGVLFIDEAHQLVPQQSGFSYGTNVINTLVPFMENHRNDICIILAGYPQQMQRLWDYDPGLKGRFTEFIDFPDYNASELLAIFKQQMNKESCYSLNFEDDDFLLSIFEKLRQIRYFANARTLRKLIDELKNIAVMSAVSNQREISFQKEYFDIALGRLNG